jgi:hypothetical protein
MMKVIILILFVHLVVACSSSQEIVLPNEPVEPLIIFNETEIPFLFGSYCWFGMNTKQGVCGDPPHPDIFNKNIKEKAIVVKSGGRDKNKFSYCTR